MGLYNGKAIFLVLVHTEGVVARCWATDPWRNMHTARDAQETRRDGLEPVLIYCSMFTERVAICAAQILRLRCA